MQFLLVLHVAVVYTGIYRIFNTVDFNIFTYIFNKSVKLTVQSYKYYIMYSALQRKRDSRHFCNNFRIKRNY